MILSSELCCASKVFLKLMSYVFVVCVCFVLFSSFCVFLCTCGISFVLILLLLLLLCVFFSSVNTAGVGLCAFIR